MRTFGTLAEAQADINKEKNDNNIVGEVAVRVAYKQGADAAAVQVSQSDHALTPTVDIRGTKRWVDNEDQRGKPHPAITVRLLRNGVEVASRKLQNGKTDYEFDGMARADADGNAYAYTVAEDPVAGYTSQVDGYDIANVFVNESIAVRGVKNWVDFGGKLRTRPDKLVIKLLQNGVEYRTLETDEAAGWRYAFQDLPRYDETGASYAYAVEEATVPAGYTSSVSPDSTQIVNTLDPARGNTTDGDSKAPDKKAGNPVAPKPLAKTGDCTPLLPAIVLLAGAGIAAFALKRTAARP